MSSPFHISGRTQIGTGSSAVDLRLMVPTKPAGEIGVHRHDEAHFILVTHGHYQTSAARRQDLAACEPLLVVNPPRTEHIDCFAAGQPLPAARFFSLTMLPQAWLQACELMDMPARPQAVSGAPVRRLAQAWLRACADNPLQGLQLGDALADAMAPFAPPAPRQGGESAAWVARLKAQLRALVMEGHAPPDLATLAQAYQLHPVYMARAFRKHLGLSPSDYVAAVQLDKAAWQIRHTRAPLAAVAQDCHFFDQAHLARKFRAAYGVPPSVYRARGAH